jgi:tetratricopeptide (TPR) repeat protein
MSREAKVILLSSTIVAALAVWVYSPAMPNDLLRWDDYAYLHAAAQYLPLTLDGVRRTMSSAVPFYYQPLTMLSHELAYEAWGWEPLGHHLINVALHAVNAALVVVFTWLLMKRVPQVSVGQRLTIVVGVGAAFAIHPLQVQAVAWVAERKTVLSALFGLASLCAYLEAVAKEPKAAWVSRMWWCTTALFFALSLLAKPMTVGLPLVLLALDFYPLRRHSVSGWRSLLKEKLVLLGFSAGSCLVTLVGPMQDRSLIAFEHVGIGLRLLEGTHAAIFYFEKLVWPAWLSPYYPPADEGWPSHGELLAAGIVFLVISVVIVWYRRRAPAAITAWVAYVALLLPVSGLIQAGSHEVVADRYVYLAMLPALLLLASALMWVWNRLGTLGHWALLALLGCELLFFGYRTRGQISAWRNDETLWSAVLERFPESSKAKCNLAMAMARQGRFEDALPLARESARATPNYWLPRATLGFVYLGTKRYAEAEHELRVAATLNPNSPDSAVAQYDLACAESMLGKFAKSYRALGEAAGLDAHYATIAQKDPDLEPLRNHPDYRDRFQLLVKESAAR